MLGIWRAGASYVPLEVAQGFERLRGIAKAARVAAVVAHSKTIGLIPKLQLCIHNTGREHLKLVVG